MTFNTLELENQNFIFFLMILFLNGIRNHGHLVNNNCSYQKEKLLFLVVFAIKIDYEKKIPFIICMCINFYLVLFPKI